MGAIILEYAAGIAGGCTSGLAISGGMLLAPAAFLFIAGMFASGILTALIVYRQEVLSHDITISLLLFWALAFGFSLNKAGLTKYHKIVNVFRFTDMAVLKFMMTALVVSMSGLYIFRGLGWITFPTVPATYIVGNLIGGLIFGVGMALTGY